MNDHYNAWLTTDEDGTRCLWRKDCDILWDSEEDEIWCDNLGDVPLDNDEGISGGFGKYNIILGEPDPPIPSAVPVKIEEREPDTRKDDEEEERKKILPGCWLCDNIHGRLGKCIRLEMDEDEDDDHIIVVYKQGGELTYAQSLSRVTKVPEK